MEQQNATTQVQRICMRSTSMGTFQQLRIPREYLPETCCHIETAQKWFTLPGKDGKAHRFPLQTILPKVLMTRSVPAKQLPKDVELDRRRKQYSKLHLEDMLHESAITDEELLPTEEQYQLLSLVSLKHFLPISFFDNTDFEAHSPQGWAQIGYIEGIQYPLPAKVYVPRNQSLLDYAWQFASLTLSDPERNTWQALVLSDERTYEVHKLLCMFLAENPRVHVSRLQAAVKARNNAESLITMDAIIDCVLLQDLKDDRFLTNDRIDKLFVPYVKRHEHAGFICNLRTEVYLVFERLMAYYEFEKFIKLMPKEFPDFSSELIRESLPSAFPATFGVSECEQIKQLKLDIKDLRHSVMRTILYYVGAGIEAMGNVAGECQYVETLSIFVCSFSKPLPLSDFLQSQHQHSSNIASYLKTFWPSKTSNGITLVLRPLGKGWLDISLGQWSVYQMCKISRFIVQVKLRMEESMQVLLEKSIDNYSHFLTDPCLQFLDLPDDYKWPAPDFINTRFPWPKPIFSMVVGISEDEKVFYSTPPEEFEPAMMEILKKALEKTSGVRCIDAETLTNLRFAPNLYIQTVELIEDLYISVNDLMQRCYRKALLPLFAYARLFERFVSFYLLNVKEYLQAYEAAKKSSVQVKMDILEHKRQKQELRDILPATITIGPFLLIVEPLKQFMIRKHIEIIKKLFEYYVQRMYEINEQLLDKCLQVYNKIAERPQSIEHLFEIRDFGTEVPERVEHLKADIQIMFLEYEMLDSFFYNLSDGQFAMKWEVYAWPHNIMQRLSTLREEQKIDIEDFRRLHLSECIGFEERLESLNEEVQTYSLQFDTVKVMETAVDVKKTWKAIQEMQRLGGVLQFRQKLFEEDDFSLAFLDSIIEGFTPYRNLWSTCADLVKLEEATMGNPLINLELAEVWIAIEEIRNQLEQAERIFYEKPELRNVATTFLERLDEFVPIYKAIKCLKNEHWLFMHWQELGARTGLEIKYSAAMNFQYLIRKGIMEHLPLVCEISEKAELEADTIRHAMEEEERRKEEERLAIEQRKAMRKCRTDIL